MTRLMPMLAVILFTPTNIGIAAIITIDGNKDRVGIREGNVDDIIRFYTSTTSDDDEIEVHTGSVVNPSSHSSMLIDFEMDASQATLTFDMDQQRSGTLYSYSAAWVNYLQFTANTNTAFVLSGYYDVHQTATNFSSLLVELIHSSTGDSIARFQDESYDASHNYSVGQLSGTLLAGEEYELRYNSLTWAIRQADDGAAAIGNVTLRISEVPAPSSLATLLGVGVMVCAWNGGRNAGSEYRQRYRLGVPCCVSCLVAVSHANSWRTCDMLVRNDLRERVFRSTRYFSAVLVEPALLFNCGR